MGVAKGNIMKYNVVTEQQVTLIMDVDVEADSEEEAEETAWEETFSPLLREIDKFVHVKRSGDSYTRAYEI